MRGVPGSPSGRACRLLLVLACLAAVSPLAAAPADVGRCPSFTYVPGAGTACRGEDGLLRVRSADGRIMLSHGTDPVAATGSTASAPARPPACVAGAAGDYYIEVIYARAIDDADEYAAKLGSVRTVVQQANGMVDRAAAAAGATADVKVLCSSSTILVRNEVLPTPKASTDYSTITEDLRRAGYNNPRLKYWVYFDERLSCGCAGMANLANDDRLRADNANNGNAASPMFAVTFGYLTASTMLHELAHTMGAVQGSAPHTTGTGHCTDGRDVMCYRDGGPRSSSYTTGRCATESFDCGRDDYFNPHPAAGTYLASRWNLGSRLNRYLAFDPGGTPVMNTLVCPGKAGVRRAYSCFARAGDTSTGLAYVVNWGDGTPSVRVPKSGFVAPNTYVGAIHAYTSARAFRVTAYAVDNSTPSRRSRPIAVTVSAINDRTAPTLTVMDPARGWLYKGCGVRSAYTPGADPAVANRACLTARTHDAGTGVAGIWIYVNNRYAGFSSAPQILAGKQGLEFTVKGPASNVPVRLEVRDWAGNVRTVTFIIDILV